MQTNREGYDQAVTLFSPDGAIYQVQYARKAVERGRASIGVAYPGGFVLISDGGPPDPLHERRVDKVLAIDEHIGCATAGLIGDARVLVDRMRREAQAERSRYGTRIGAEEVVRRIGQFLQSYTQNGGVRPFGVSLLIGDAAGDMGIRLLNPAGASTRMSAAAIGEGSRGMSEVLQDRIEEATDRESAVSLGLDVLDDSISGEMQGRLVGVGIGEDGRFELMPGDWVEKRLESRR
ncbi:MAG: Proteasome subunit alpha [Methanonatronarchaeales archaeon]|nr:Proteasome subunit alpha [Methanonatronarchaeales archaeon]